MTKNEDHKAEAERLLRSRIREMATYLALTERGIDIYEYNDELEGHDLSPINEYGLDWHRYLTNHEDGTVVYKHVLSTGGPHDEFQVTFEGYSVVGVTFVYLPWWDRVEIELAPHAVGYSVEQVQIVTDFYDQLWGAYVEVED